MSIAPMTRIYLVGPSQARERAMALLQSAGVVHIDLPREKVSKIADLPELKRIDAVLKALDRYANRDGISDDQIPDDQLVSRVETLTHRLGEISARLAHLENMISDLEPWGDFDPAHAEELRRHGLYVNRYRAAQKDPEAVKIPQDAYLQVVSQKKYPLFFVISHRPELEIPQAVLLGWPEMGLEQARREQQSLTQQQEMVGKTLAGLAGRREAVKKQYTEALNRATLEHGIAALHSQEYLFGLEGWLPSENESLLQKTVSDSGIPLKLEMRKPSDDEQPPLLLKNNRFIRRIEPLLKLYGLPQYRDIDPSYFFAPFMILFFGICLSDAGYGLVFLLAAHLMEKKLGPKNPALILPLKLCQAFAVSTIVVGLITGSVFGYEFASRQWILLDVSVGVGNPMLFFYLALGLGVLHLSFSYLLGMLQASNFQGVLQKLATLLVLWGGVTLVSRNIWFASASYGQMLYFAGSGLITLGLLLTLLFSSDHKNWLARIGLGLWSIYGLTGLIGDLLSYARLFGLGIATSAIASVMNQLAGMVYGSAGPVLGIPLAVLILIAGHSFNLALSILGSTVHSARLHFVEAFKNFFQGGGIEYKPFKTERG
ncbi:MAG: V-type ATPase 116kDa subunit family protein [Candidatus Edwardsbacteria bacterium]|nr:V-type ATPase 116kDa subunit family protein [Candidatus Edwardsbacteria bacterium]